MLLVRMELEVECVSDAEKAEVAPEDDEGAKDTPPTGRGRFRSFKDYA